MTATERADGRCPVCQHSLRGYHVAYPPGAAQHPRADDINLRCGWCDEWCRQAGVRRPTDG